MKILSVRLEEEIEDSRNVQRYEKGQIVHVEDNEFGDYFRIWYGSKLDLIPKEKCIVLGIIKER